MHRRRKHSMDDFAASEDDGCMAMNTKTHNSSSNSLNCSFSVSEHSYVDSPPRKPTRTLEILHECESIMESKACTSSSLLKPAMVELPPARDESPRMPKRRAIKPWWSKRAMDLDLQLNGNESYSELNSSSRALLYPLGLTPPHHGR